MDSALSTPPVAPRTPRAGDGVESGASQAVVWLALSIGALALAVMRVPLSSRYLPNGERLAIYFVLTAQLLASAAGLAFFLRSWRSTLAILLTGLPVLTLGGAMSVCPVSRMLAAAGFVTLWIIGLRLVTLALPTDRARGIAGAVAVLATIGGPFLWYLRYEFNSGEGTRPVANSRFGPLFAAFEIAGGSGFDLLNLLLPLIPLVLGLAMLIARRTRLGRTNRRVHRRDAEDAESSL